MDTDFNPDKQHTLEKETSISGTGLHTGAYVTMGLHPAGVNHGYKFQRIDLPNQPIIKADCDLVTETARGTTLEANGGKISTVEHILAALVATGVDNCLVTIDGPEVPIIDGSSLPFIKIIEEAGIIEQDADKEWISIDEILSYDNAERNVEISALPSPHYRVTTMIDFNSPVLGTQHAQLKQMADFKKEIAPCRTFVFLHELEMLLDHDLIKGGDINNAIVVVDQPITDDAKTKLRAAFKKDDIEIQGEGYLNNLELNFPNEPARHKLLDIVGDLALIGYPIKANIIAHRPGHAANVEFAKQVKQFIKQKLKLKDVPIYDPTLPPVYDLGEIEKTLPHRFPFLLVDKIIKLSETEIIGIKNVTFNEWFFQGHFPNNPVMPGVLQIEALAQCGGILCINAMPEGKYDTYFLKIDNCKFKGMIRPGDTMILKMELSAPIRRGICDMKASVYVGNKLCTEAQLMAQLVKRP